MVGTQLCKLFLHRCACHPDSQPSSCTTVIHQREAQDSNNRRRPTSSGWSANGLCLSILRDSEEKQHLHPFPRVTFCKATPVLPLRELTFPQYSLLFLPGLLAVRLVDLMHWVRYVGFCHAVRVSIDESCSNITLVVATAATAECEESWPLFVFQGFLIGMSCGVNFGPIPTTLSHWLKKPRLLSPGINAAGSSLGGTVTRLYPAI